MMNAEHGMSNSEVRSESLVHKSSSSVAEGRTPKRRFDLQPRLVGFAIIILDIVDTLSKNVVGTHLAGQMVRCGTSPAANYAEAQSAESRKDFIHKMKVCLKELRETSVWLDILITQTNDLLS